MLNSFLVIKGSKVCVTLHTAAESAAFCNMIYIYHILINKLQNKYYNYKIHPKNWFLWAILLRSLSNYVALIGANVFKNIVLSGLDANKLVNSSNN